MFSNRTGSASSSCKIFSSAIFNAGSARIIVDRHSIHLAPGEPSEVDPSNPRMKPEDIANIRAAFHLDDPLYLQYVYWVRDLASGELKSFKDSQPVLGENLAPVSQLAAPLYLCHVVGLDIGLSHWHSCRRAAWGRVRPIEYVCGLYAHLDSWVFLILSYDPLGR